MIDPLSRLAILYGTDKFGYHDYTPNYHELLSARRGQRLSMLEIGVGGYGDEKRGGESLEALADSTFPFPGAGRQQRRRYSIVAAGE